MKHLLLILSALLCFVACGEKKGVDEVLCRAELLMNDYPDSAYVLLQSISVGEILKKSNQARFALLYSQALDKRYIDETNDSLITIAVNYYQDTNDVYRRFLSYYYMGRVYANGADYLKAFSCFIEAEQYVADFEDNYAKGLLYAEMGRIFRLYYDYPKSLEAHQKAADYYEQAGKIRHRNYMWLNQSDICRNINDYDNSERLLQQVLNSSQEEKDSTLTRLAMGTMIMQYVEQEKMEKADSLYEKFKSLASIDFGSSSFMMALARMNLANKNFEQAELYLDKGWKHANNQVDSISLYVASSELYSLKGKGEIAYRELQKGILLQNKEAYQALQQPILTTRCDYLTEKMEFEAYKLRMKRYLYILYAFFFSFCLGLVTFYLYRNLKKKVRKTIDDLNQEMLQRDKESRSKITSLLQELENKDKESLETIHFLRLEVRKQEENYHQYVREMENLQHDLQNDLQQKKVFVAELFKNWFEMMGTIVFFYEQKEVKENYKAKNIRKEINLIKEKYITGNKAIRELESMVNIYNDDAMSFFRREISYTNESDYRRVCYFFAGFSIQTIAWLMSEKVNNVYQKRLRLRKYIASSVLPHKDLFIMLLSK